MKLAKREKLFVGAAACTLGLFLIIELLIAPFFHKKDRLEKDIKTIEQNIADLATIGIGSQGTEDMERVLSRRKDSLLVFLNKAAGTTGLEKNLKRLNPTDGKDQGAYLEEVVDVTLDAITLPQLTEYLYRIEKPEQFIFVKRINISDNKKEEGYLNANIRVLTYKQKESSGQ